jgi:hypothetical protein
MTGVNYVSFIFVFAQVLISTMPTLASDLVIPVEYELPERYPKPGDRAPSLEYAYRAISGAAPQNTRPNQNIENYIFDDIGVRVSHQGEKYTCPSDKFEITTESKYFALNADKILSADDHRIARLLVYSTENICDNISDGRFKELFDNISITYSGKLVSYLSIKIATTRTDLNNIYSIDSISYSFSVNPREDVSSIEDGRFSPIFDGIHSRIVSGDRVYDDSFLRRIKESAREHPHLAAAYHYYLTSHKKDSSFVGAIGYGDVLTGDDRQYIFLASVLGHSPSAEILSYGEVVRPKETNYTKPDSFTYERFIYRTLGLALASGYSIDVVYKYQIEQIRQASRTKEAYLERYTRAGPIVFSDLSDTNTYVDRAPEVYEVARLSTRKFDEDCENYNILLPYLRDTQNLVSAMAKSTREQGIVFEMQNAYVVDMGNGCQLKSDIASIPLGIERIDDLSCSKNAPNDYDCSYSLVMVCPMNRTGMAPLDALLRAACAEDQKRTWRLQAQAKFQRINPESAWAMSRFEARKN